MTLVGFDPEFEDLPDYILKITEQIWEGRNVGAIHRFYAADCLVHTGMGSTRGIAAVVAHTLATQSAFPDRLILGEDVIGTGTADGLLSSHRSIMTQTHRGFGVLGAPTGRALAFRAIADCAVRQNQIYEEWLVVDQSAAVRQAGLDPQEFGRRLAQADQASGAAPPSVDLSDDRPGHDTRGLSDDPAARLVRDLHEAIWRDCDLAVLRTQYHRAVNVHLPGGSTAYGGDQYGAFLFGYLASFPDAVFTIDHSIARHDPGRPARVATRWRLTGTHGGTGVFGPPSGAPMLVLGVTHTELVDQQVTREWVVFDETAVWCRIGHQLG